MSILHDAVVLQLRNLGSLEGIRAERITNNVLLCSLLEFLDEFVIDALLDVDPGAGAAALAVVVEDTEVDPRDGVVYISIVEDNVRALAAKFKSDLLQVRSGSGLHDLPTNDRAARESNLVNIHVCGDGSTGYLSETREDVDYTWRKTSLLDKFGSVQSTQRRLLCGFEDHGITASYGRPNFP